MYDRLRVRPLPPTTRRVVPALLVAALLSMFLAVSLALAADPGPILVLSLRYQQGRFSLIRVEARSGYVPDSGSPVDPQDLFMMLVLDAAGKPLLTQEFSAGKVVWGAPILGEIETPSAVVVPDVVEPAVILRDVPGATTLELYDLSGRLLLRVPDLQVRIERAPPPAQPQSGEDISAPCCGDNCLDILFLGDDYTTTASLDTFRSDVGFMANYFRAVAPYSEHPNLINFRALPSTQDLQCTYDCYGTPRLICCNNALVAAQASQVPHDKVIVLVNNEEYGGSGGTNYAIAYHRTPQYGPQVAIHEFGHSFALLGDEYSFGPNSGWNDLRGNCDDQPTCPRWYGLANTSCIPGCTYDEWFRATDDCLMLRIRTEPASGTFCPVCQRIIGNALEPFGDEWQDTNCDGATDVLDVAGIASAWNRYVTYGVYDPNFDVDNSGIGDGDVDIVDVSLVASRLFLP